MSDVDGSVDGLTAAVAAELRAYRGATRVTYEQLEERTGITKRSLIRYFNGQRDIDVRTIDLLSGPLEFEPEELLSRAMARVRRGSSV